MLDIENIISSLEYSEDSPSFLIWKSCPSNIKKNGKTAGHLHKESNYWETRLKGVLFRNHRLVWILHNGLIPESHIIDHIDGNRQNNNIKNLRLVTSKINNTNKRKRSKNITGKTGVIFNIKDNAYVAIWYENNKFKQKYFSRAKYGLLCFYYACAYRDKMIKYLNTLGDGYTERHGL